MDVLRLGVDLEVRRFGGHEDGWRMSGGLKLRWSGDKEKVSSLRRFGGYEGRRSL